MRIFVNWFLKLLLFMTLSEHAMGAMVRDFQSWFNVTAIGKFHSEQAQLSKLRYWLEGQERVGDDSSRISQTLLRPGIGYALSNELSLWMGYAWIYTGEPFTSQPFEENRIWQQLLWVKTSSYLTFTSRTRTEQRFLENAPKTAYRIRELVKFSIPFKRESKLSLVLSDEVFWHKNDFIGKNGKGFDQNRFFSGVGYKFNPTATAEIGYLNQYIKRIGVPNFLNNSLSIALSLSL